MGYNYVFKLYVVGGTPTSKEAIANVKKILQDAGLKYSLEVIDVLDHPELVVDAGVAATPTLIKESPLPTKKIIGKLDDKNRVLTKLGLNKVV